MARSIEVQADLDDDAVLLADTTVDADDSMAEIRTPRSRRYVEDFTDGSTLFPWADMPFFIVSTVDAELKALLKKRITVSWAHTPTAMTSSFFPTPHATPFAVRALSADSRPQAEPSCVE